MGDLILKIFNMSFNAGIMVLAVLVIRIFAKKAPKYINILLWLAVALRLVIPFSFESVTSILPSKEVITTVTTTIEPSVSDSVSHALEQTVPQVDIGVPVINDTVNEYISESVVNTPTAEKSFIDVMFILGIVWAVGLSAMLIYALISYIRLKSKVKISLCKEKNIYYCDYVSFPFVLGIIKPKIYLPSNINPDDEQYVLKHENAHIKAKDYLWKPIGFILLSVHWFNPLIWVAYVMLCRDIELACDEKAIKNMSKPEKIEYSKSLLNCSENNKLITVNPLTFGGISVKERIKNILNYKKAPLWITVIAIVLCCALMVGFLTDPVDKKKTDKKPTNAQTVTSQTEDTTDTSSEPTESVVSTPTESKPTESKPTVSSKEETVTKPVESKPVVDLATKREELFKKLSPKQSVKVRNQVVDWLLSDSKPSEKKLYTDAEIAKMRAECESYNIEPDLIFVGLTEKASKELFFKEFTPADFPNIDCKRVEFSEIERNAVLTGKPGLGFEYSTLPDGQVVEKEEEDYILDKFEGRKLSIRIYVNEQTKENIIENMIKLQRMDIVEYVECNFLRYPC